MATATNDSSVLVLSADPLPPVCGLYGSTKLIDIPAVQGLILHGLSKDDVFQTVGAPKLLNRDFLLSSLTITIMHSRIHNPSVKAHNTHTYVPLRYSCCGILLPSLYLPCLSMSRPNNACYSLFNPSSNHAAKPGQRSTAELEKRSLSIGHSR